MDSNAIPELVCTLLEHPEAFTVLTNLINSENLAWLHYHLGAIHAYMPELSLPTNPVPTNGSYGPHAWRASALPDWKSETPEEIPRWPDKENNENGSATLAAIGAVGGAPYQYHRWLPLRHNDSDIYSTPIAETEWRYGSNNQKRWALGAQSHYSLLENLEKGQLQRYMMAGGTGTFNMRHFHANVNLMAVWGKDIQENMPYGGGGWDEMVLTVDIPKALHRGSYTCAAFLLFSFSSPRSSVLFWHTPLSRSVR